jgi:beta propeller repeat protein
LSKGKLLGIIVFLVIITTLFIGLEINGVHAANVIFTESQITSNSASQENPDICEHGRYNYTIVWQDNRNSNWDIYMYAPYLDMWNPEIRVTTSSGNETNPKIYNDTIVYQSDRNGNWDIYMYNMSSKVETQITSDAAIQCSPAVYGNTIVWQDARNAVWNSNYHDYSPWNIYMYNLTTQTEQRITRQNEDCFSPAICGNLITYMKEIFTYVSSYVSGYYYYPYVCSYDLSTGIETNVYTLNGQRVSITYANYTNSPAIDKTRIVWSTKDAKTSGLYVEMKDVLTGASLNIENNVLDANPDIYAGSYNTYLVFERTPPSPATNTNIYLYDWNAKTTHNVTYSTASQSRPIISAEYSNCIVYMDNRNGNWDIYLTIFGYGLGATGPNPQSTSSTPTGQTGILGNQDLIITAIISVVAIAAILAVVFAVTRRGRPKKQELLHTP